MNDKYFLSRNGNVTSDDVFLRMKLQEEQSNRVKSYSSDEHYSSLMIIGTVKEMLSEHTISSLSRTIFPFRFLPFCTFRFSSSIHRSKTLLHLILFLLFDCCYSCSIFKYSIRSFFPLNVQRPVETGTNKAHLS
jgi:hypothetical protein